MHIVDTYSIMVVVENMNLIALEDGKTMVTNTTIPFVRKSVTSLRGKDRNG